MSRQARRPGDPAWTSADSLAITALTAIACVIRAIRLSTPPFIYSDELFYAREACNYVYRSAVTCGIPLDAISAHPPLGKWLISLGVRALGWEPLGWRMPGLVAGTATIALLYLLARRLLGSTRGATLAAGLLAIDFLHVVQSRIAMLDVFLALFVVMSVLFVVLDRDRQAARAPGAGARPSGPWSRPWLLAAGLAAGAAAATKWVGVMALLGSATLAWVWAWPRTPSTAWRVKLRSTVRREWLAMLCAFLLVPVVAYTASYAGKVEGSLATVPLARGSWTRNFARAQREMVDFHRTSAEIRYLGKTNRFVSPAWSWPLIRRPMTYYSEPQVGGKYVTVRAMGNPFVWWTSIVALVYLAVQIARRRGGDASLVAVIGVAVMYLPLLIVSGARSATFLYYMLPSVPFMCLAIAAAATERTRPFSGWITAASSLTAVVLFAFFYPVLTGALLSPEELRAREWFTDCRPSAGTVAPAGWCWN